MNVASLRESFAEFLGADRYRRFVWQINRRDRLRAWQEEVWGKFVSANPVFAGLSEAEVRECFTVCEVHGDEFQTYSTRVIHGNVDFTLEYEIASSSQFPHAKLDFWSTEGRSFDKNTIELRFCPACCEAKSKWESEVAKGRAD